MSVFNFLREKVAEIISCPENAINRDTLLLTDMGMDSVQLIELFYYLEREYGVDIARDKIEELEKVSDLEKYLIERIND